MIWYLLFGYVATTQLIVVVVLALAYAGGDCPGMAPIQAQSGSSKFVNVLFLFLTGFVMAPLAFPFMVYSYMNCVTEVKEEVQYWQTVQKSFAELSLEPLHPCNRKQEFDRFAESQSEFANALNYKLLGDVWLKNFEPFRSQGRFFLDVGQTTIVEIARTMETNVLELTSFLDDGTVITSANCGSVEAFSKMETHGYLIHCLPEMELDQMILLHNEYLNRASEKANNSVRRIEAERWREYVHYNNRRFGKIQFELGEKDFQPEVCQFPLSTNEAVPVLEGIVATDCLNVTC